MDCTGLVVREERGGRERGEREGERESGREIADTFIHFCAVRISKTLGGDSTDFRNPGVWKIVYEFSSGIWQFYYKEFLPLFPAPVTFIYFNLEKFLLYLKCSPTIPLQKSHSPHFCQTTLYIFFWVPVREVA